MPAAALTCHAAEQCAGENTFLTHHALNLVHMNRHCGRAYVSIYDAAAAEALCSSARFLAQPGTYLSRYAQYLFDPASPRARLPLTIREDLHHQPAQVLIIDEFDFKAPATSSALVREGILQVMSHFREVAGIMLLPNWPMMAAQFGILSSNMMDEMARAGIMPMDALTLIGFMEDLALFLPDPVDDSFIE